jgi:D-glycero-D-manno-heptose 1,7-bisphosphate phosphatase
MPGMFIKAKNIHNIDFKKSWMIGDSERDIRAANLAGIKNTILVNTSNSRDEATSKANFFLSSVEQAIDVILK